MLTNTFSPWGPFYGDAPFLQGAINHAERLTEVLKVTRASPEDDYGAAWLFGRIEEMEIFVELILQRWLFDGLDELAAGTAITAYLDTLHQGLAFYFGELSPACCSDALLATSIPAAPLSKTTEIPAFAAMQRPVEDDATVIDVDPAELLLRMTPAPLTPTPRVC
jgi:hypothetical protein